MGEVLTMVVALGGGSFIGWIMSALITGGEYKNKIKKLEEIAHPAPCAEINAIKVSIERIETNVRWLCKQAEEGKR